MSYNSKIPVIAQANSHLFSKGCCISLYGIALILLWTGVFRFIFTEVAVVQPLISSYPLMVWLYRLLDIQTLLNLIGIIEVLTAIAIILSPFQHIFRSAAYVGILTIFLIMLSFLFTVTSCKIMDGVSVIDFFILKEIVFLRFGLMILGFPHKNLSINTINYEK